MEIKLLNPQEHQGVSNQILEILTMANEEFVPPLSSRASTTQQDLLGNDKGDGVQLYFEEMKKQRLLIAYNKEQVLAFVSYKENFVNDEIGNTTLPNIYITTLVVRPEFRGKGLTKAMYKWLFSFYKNANIFTRTWSTNLPHIRILSQFGFHPFRVLKNHRGQGVDTVYFQKTPNSTT